MTSSILDISISPSRSLLWNGAQLAVFLVAQSWFCFRSSSFKEGIFKSRPNFKRKVFVLIIMPLLSIAGLSQAVYSVTPCTLPWFISLGFLSSVGIIILTQVLLSSSIVIFCYQSAYSIVHTAMLFGVESNLLSDFLKRGEFPWLAIFAYAAMVAASMGVTMVILYGYRKEWKQFSYAERHRTAFYMATMALLIGLEPVVLFIGCWLKK